MISALLRLAPAFAAAGAVWREKRRQAVLGALAFVAAASCASLALAFAGWALFACLAQSMPQAAAAAWTAVAFAAIASCVGVAAWLVIRARRRRAPDYGGLLGAIARADLPRPAPASIVAGGLVLGVLAGLLLDARHRR